jgi:hypothetical protein
MRDRSGGSKLNPGYESATRSTEFIDGRLLGDKLVTADDI